MPKVIYDFGPDKLPPDFLAAIGLVTASWAQTENSVQTFIGACLGVDVEYAIAVTAHMSHPLRDDVARAVAEIRIDDLDALDELDTILNRVNEAAGKRNAVAHRSWCRHPETDEVFTVKETARGSVQVELIPMSVSAIKEDAAFIYEAGLDVVRLMIALGLEPSFPGIRPRGHKSKAARKARRQQNGKG